MRVLYGAVAANAARCTGLWLPGATCAAAAGERVRTALPPQRSRTANFTTLRCHTRAARATQVYEYSDMVLVLLQGYPVHIHFRLHHWTSLAWTFARTRASAGASFLLANAFMHAWVYLYHGGARWKPVFWVCRVWGHAQLAIGMLCSGHAAWYSYTHEHEDGGRPCGDGPYALHAWGCFLCALYFCLFQYEVWGPQPGEAPAKKRKGGAKLE